MSPRAELPEDLFAPLSGRIAEVSGIRIPKEKQWLLSARVADRMKALGERDPRGYVRSVLADNGAAELGQLVEAVRVGETQFFRHQGQLRAIRRVALPAIVSRLERDGQRVVRVWSAGCATGEEAYTLSMLLGDVLAKHEGFRYEILATDLSDRALALARAGSYPATATRNVPAHVARWAVVANGDEVKMSDTVRAPVRFEHQNLLHARYPRGFDLVLCRNVLIYFDRATQGEVVLRLAKSVVEGGYLALGYAERLGDRALLEPLRTDDGILYLRGPGPVERPKPPEPAARPPSSTTEEPAPTDRQTDAKPTKAHPNRLLTPILGGELVGDEGVAKARAAVALALTGPPPHTLDLRGLRFADDRVARVLARAAHAASAEGYALQLLTSASGTERFLRRHGVVPPAQVRSDSPENRS